jgi:hypothetical protein
MRSYVPNEERREIEVEKIISALKIIDYTEYKKQY